MDRNSYAPRPALITSVRPEAERILTFEVQLQGIAGGAPFAPRPGQFLELTVFGVGEAPISIASPGNESGTLLLTVAAVGEVTEALHEKAVGDVVGIRGPYGNGFPMEAVEGHHLVFLAGGIGLAPLRPAIMHAFSHRKAYGRISVLYGAREPKMLCFREDLEAWAQEPDSEVMLTVDTPDDRWSGGKGPVTTLLPAVSADIAHSAALVCGPPVMIRIALEKLAGMGFSPERTLTTLERRMECGVGKCGHCNVGGVHVCTDGPVFSQAELARLTEGV